MDTNDVRIIDPTPKTLYCIRHGESTFNEWRKRSLWTCTWICISDPEISDAPLSARGQTQVVQLRHQLEKHGWGQKIEKVFISPLTRAIDTALGAFPDPLPPCESKFT